MSQRFRRLALPAALTLALFGLNSCNNKETEAAYDTPEEPGAPEVIRVVDLRCEGKLDPIAAPKQPRLSWRLEAGGLRGVNQAAWQIMVASKPELLEPGKADLWNSGKTESKRSPLITYAGKELTAGQVCHWKVRIWDQDEKQSDWSEVATFEVAPTTPADWRGAQWIDDGKALPEKDEDFYKEDPAPLMRREFQLEKPIQKARLHVAGLGLCYPSLNGARIDDHLFDPAWTDFEKRILYRTHDVTAQLKTGANCIGIEVGNGWFNPLPLRMWGGRNIRDSVPLGRPRAIALLVIDHPDGTQTTITTGADWQTTEGPTLRNSIYMGEVRDARLAIPGWNQAGTDVAKWKAVHTVEAPLETLQPLGMHPVRTWETLTPVSITSVGESAYIVDFGVNFSGIPELKLKAPAGTKISLRYGELLHADGSLNPMTAVCGQIKGMIDNKDGTKRPKGGPGAPEFAWQEDHYIAAGNGVETYRPDFTFRAFRFMEITGLTEKPKADDIKALVFNTELPTVGTFASSNELFNRIQKMCLRTFHANVMTVQSDCPHRERFGYGGDIVATSETFLMNFDMNGFYAKTVRDWGDAQLEGGLMPDTAPYVGIKYCGVGWGMVHPLLIEQLYQHYGDLELLKEQLPVALSWIEAEAKRRENGLVTVGLGDHEALLPGDQKKGAELKTPKFIDSARRIARLATIAGDSESATRCLEWATESQTAWEKAFLDKATGKVDVARQTQQAFALGFGAVADDSKAAVFDVLVKDLTKTEDSPRLTTGIYGTWKLLEVLPDNGRNDLAYGLANRKTFPSWGWMLENDATTLWEHWEGSDNTFSNNHPMFGSISGWFFRWLGGIQCAPDAIGFDRILIKPMPVEGLDWVKTSHESIRGTIVSNWKRVDGGIEYEVVIPPNSTAIISLPGMFITGIGTGDGITENGKPIQDGNGINAIHLGTDVMNIEVSAGSYHFKVARESRE